jgi:hypothetical protein
MKIKIEILADLKFERILDSEKEELFSLINGTFEEFFSKMKHLELEKVNIFEVKKPNA